MRKIKILMCGLSKQIGGIEMFVLNYIKKINFKNFQIDFINVYGENIQKEYYDELQKYGNVYYLDNYRTRPFKFIKQLKELQKKNKYDIFHYNMASSVFLAPLIGAKKAGIKRIISHAHNDASDKGIIKELIHRFNKNFVSSLSNFYFACSDNAAKWFFQKKIYTKNNYTIIDNAIDIKKFYFNEFKRDKIRNKIGISADDIVYGNVGNFKAIKNHEFLIDVFFEIQKRQRNSKLVLIGEGNTLFDIKNKVKELNIEDKVLFLGQKNNINDYLSAMDVFIFPSKHEGLGISYIEAQISGLPCVISESIPYAADINDIHCRLPLKNPESWAIAAIEYSNIFSRNFINNVCKYDINNAVKKLEKIYEEISKIKIVHFVYGIRNGGVEKVITSYFSNMDRDNFDLHIITQGENDEKNLKEFLALNFKVHTVTKKRISFIKNYKETMRILRKYKFDVAHCHMSNTNFFPIVYSLLSGIKIRINHSHNAFARKVFWEKIFMFFSNCICTDKMACSEDAAKWLFGKNKNVMIVKNAIYPEQFAYSEQSNIGYRKEFHIDENDFVIGMVARFEEQKNHLFIMDVLKKMINKNSNIKVVFVGVGPLEDKIKTIVNEEKISDHFYFLSSRNDVNKLYSLFDLFVLPSLYEGLGIVLVEAQISGLTCLTSNFVPRSVDFTGNVKFLELDKEKWIKEITNKLFKTNRTEFSKEASLAGYNIIIESKKIEEKYIDLYRKG